MIRPPPISPPFPYTTLFRSREPAHDQFHTIEDRALSLKALERFHDLGQQHRRVEQGDVGIEFGVPVLADSRSEEHTSELQSRQYLVCRLLLEKKKKQ